MQKLQKAKIKGLIGRLGDLAGMPAKYDIAASTTGGELDSVLVQDKEAGERVVQYCREHNLGVVRCLSLDRQVQEFSAKLAGEAERPFQAPSGSQRIFDLLQGCPAELLPAFYKCFRDTLVCEGSKEDAKRIAVGNPSRKFRVVLLNGVVYNTNGTMEGGGKPIEGKIGKGGAAAGLSEREMRQLETAMVEADAALQRAQAGKEEAEAALQVLQKELSKKQTALRKLTLQGDSAGARQQELEGQVANAASAGELSAEEVKRSKEIVSELGKLGADVKKAHEAVNEVDKQLEALKEEREKAGGEELRNQKGEVDKKEKELKKIRKAKDEVDGKVDDAKESLVKLEKAIEVATGKAEEWKAKREALEAEFEPKLDAAGEVEKEMKQEEERLKKREEELAQMKATYDESRRRIDKSAAKKMQKEMDELAAKITSEQGGARHWRSKLTGLREQVDNAAALLTLTHHPHPAPHHPSPSPITHHHHPSPITITHHPSPSPRWTTRPPCSRRRRRSAAYRQARTGPR